MKHIPKTALVITGLLLFASCAKSGGESSKTSSDSTVTTTSNATKAPASTEGIGNGVVKSIDIAEKSIELDHGDIPGVMMAMTMSYPVENVELLQAAKVGDSVQFTLKKTGSGDFLISTLTPIGKH